MYNALTYSPIHKIKSSRTSLFKIKLGTRYPKRMRSLAYPFQGTKDLYVILFPQKHEKIDAIIRENSHPESVSVRVNRETGEPEITHNKPGSRR